MKNSAFSNYKVFAGNSHLGAGGGNRVHNGKTTWKSYSEQIQ